MIGSWDIKVSVGSMPEKVATAIGKLGEALIGAEYTPIAYLGSQLVNGTNHAVLAEQLLTTGKDTKNIVVLIFNEKGTDCSLVNIERILESGEPLGGAVIDVKTEISAEAQEVFEKGMNGFVGANIKPFALLGTQEMKGTNYIFAGELETVTAEPEKRVVMIAVNAMSGKMTVIDVLACKRDAVLGYAFEWLKR